VRLRRHCEQATWLAVPRRSKRWKTAVLSSALVAKHGGTVHHRHSDRSRSTGLRSWRHSPHASRPYQCASLASRPHADLRIRRAVQLCRKLLRMAIRGVGEIWLVGSRCLTPADKQRPARGSRASATLLDHQDAHAVGQQGVDALRNGNELPTTDVLPRVQARSSSYCATGGIWPMFAQRADFPDRAGCVWSPFAVLRR
jgi:hypothetical protein